MTNANETETPMTLDTGGTAQVTPAELRRWRETHTMTGGMYMSQARAAHVFGVALRTWQDWEAGRNGIPHWVGRYLLLIDVANGGQVDVNLFPM